MIFRRSWPARELAVAFDELLKRLDRIEIADEAALTYPPNMLLRGLSALPIRFVAR